jgi:rhodanese-related sulfurtransferase
METAVGTPTVITLDDLQRHLDAGNVAEFWNVLTDQYYSGELLPGSRRMPLDMIGRLVMDIPHDSEIVVYCANFACPQSGMAARKLASLGFTNVYVYEGGIQEWCEAGNQIVMDVTVAA